MSGARGRPVKRHYTLRDVRCGADNERPLLSVSIYRGVVPRTDLTDKVARADDLSSYKVVEPGDIVINRMSAYQGALGIALQEGIVSPEYIVLRPSRSADARFLTYLFKSSWFVSEMTLRLRGIGSTEQGNVRTPRISPEDLGSIPAALPPAWAQRVIADFLDRETTRIDALIAAKRRMIEVLEERHVSLVTKAISGGESCALDATADDLFPNLPTGWVVAQVGALTHGILDGPHVSPTYVEPEDGVPFISVRNIFTTHWDLESAKYITRRDFETFSRRVRPELGDVLLTKGGSTGIARVVDLPFEFHVWVHVAILKVDHTRVRPEFLAAALNSRPGYEQSQLGTRGATNQDLALGRIAKIRVPLPPPEVQDRIMSELVGAAASILGTLDRLTRQIDLLVEHRQALITAAVTGELEIPGVAA